MPVMAAAFCICQEQRSLWLWLWAVAPPPPAAHHVQLSAFFSYLVEGAPKRWLTISASARITTRPKAPEIIIDPGVAIGSAVQHLFGDTTRKHFQFPFRRSHGAALWAAQLPRGWLQALLPGSTLMRLAPRPTSIDSMHNAAATWHASKWACVQRTVSLSNHHQSLPLIDARPSQSSELGIRHSVRPGRVARI